MIVLPPSLAGAVQAREIVVAVGSVAPSITVVGASGTAANTSDTPTILVDTKITIIVTISEFFITVV